MPPAVEVDRRSCASRTLPEAPTAPTSPDTCVMPSGGSVHCPEPRAAPDAEKRVPFTVTGDVPAFARTRFVRKEPSWRMPTIERAFPAVRRSAAAKAGTDCPNVPPGLVGSGVEVCPRTFSVVTFAVRRIAP